MHHIREVLRLAAAGASNRMISGYLKALSAVLARQSNDTAPGPNALFGMMLGFDDCTHRHGCKRPDLVGSGGDLIDRPVGVDGRLNRQRPQRLALVTLEQLRTTGLELAHRPTV
jgi:hypothetical protein